VTSMMRPLVMISSYVIVSQAWGTRTMVPLELYGQMALIEIPPAVVTKLLSENVDSDAEDGETPTSLHSKVLQVP
jgi:hypothetical protein